MIRYNINDDISKKQWVRNILNTIPNNIGDNVLLTNIKQVWVYNIHGQLLYNGADTYRYDTNLIYEYSDNRFNTKKIFRYAK